MIKQANELNFYSKKFSVIIYGQPGIGKTTVALSAPTPLLLDFDRGVSRVRAEHRKATSVCDNYEEILEDLKSPEIKQFETIVIDTGGSFITFLKDWAMRTQLGCKTKTGEFNSMKGFGVVKNEFARFTEYIKTTLNKNVIYVFHSVESTDKDGNPVQRLNCEGSTKNTVWTPCDFGGYMQMIGNDRDICFSPEQEFFAKGCHGVRGHRNVPELPQGAKNDFLTKLFEEAKNNIRAEQDVFVIEQDKYNNAMAQANTIIEKIGDIDSVNSAVTELQMIEHALTSKREASALLNAKAKELGLAYDKTNKQYVAKG